MHDVWNPWHGCIKCSPGCEHCYMYFLDKTRADKDGRDIHRNSDGVFRYPLSKNRQGQYKVQSGERLRVCMTSDFFLQEADLWREDAWSIIRQRPDVKFWLLTKRPERILSCLPADWGDGYENVMLNVTAENQLMADIRLPILLSVPAKHRGVCVAPWIGPVSLKPWLETGLLDEVCGGGENYDGCRVCDFDWVKALRAECMATDTTFCWYETGTRLLVNGCEYYWTSKSRQSLEAYRSGANYKGREISWKLYSPTDGHLLQPEELWQRRFCLHCVSCANRLICNGCAGCVGCNQCGHGQYQVSMPDEPVTVPS